MKQAALPFDHDHLVVLVGQHQFFRRAGHEIGDHAIDRAAAAGRPGCRSGRWPRTRHRRRARFSPSVDFDGGDHLAATAIVADGMDPQAAFADAPAVGHVVLVVAADVDQPHAVPAAAAANSGSSLRNSCRPETTFILRRDGFQDDRPPVRRDFAARRSDADQQGVGRRGLGQRGDHRDRAAHAQQLLAGLARPTADPARPPLPRGR